MSDVDVVTMASAAEELAKPIASLAIFMADGSLAQFWVALRALELAALAFAGNTLLPPEAMPALEQAAQAAAERISAGWRESEARIEFSEAASQATQVGGEA